MFNVTEFEGLEVIEHSLEDVKTRYIVLDSDKGENVLYLHNSRTDLYYKMHITYSKDDNSCKLVIINSKENIDDKEYVFSCGVPKIIPFSEIICVYIVESKFHIIASDEIVIYN